MGDGQTYCIERRYPHFARRGDANQVVASDLRRRMLGEMMAYLGKLLDDKPRVVEIRWQDTEAPQDQIPPYAPIIHRLRIIAIVTEVARRDVVMDRFDHRGMIQIQGRTPLRTRIANWFKKSWRELDKPTDTGGCR